MTHQPPLWTDEEDQRLRDLFRAGRSDEEIVAMMGRPKKGIQGRRKRLGLMQYSRAERRQKHEELCQRIRELAGQPITLAEMASRVGCVTETARRLLDKMGLQRPVRSLAPSARNQAVLEAIKAGTPRSVVAEQFGLNRHQISGIVYRAAGGHGSSHKRTPGSRKGTEAREVIAARGIAADYEAIKRDWPGPRQCRYITGDPRPAPQWCKGKVAYPGESWCEEHLAVVASE